jgi:hypothetical protein
MTRFMGMFVSAAALCLIITVTPTPTNAQIALTCYQMTYNAIDDGSVDVALDGDGNTHMVYVRDGNVYYKLNGYDEELITAGSAPSLALTAAGIPHIVCISGGLAAYSHRTSGSWSVPAALANGSVTFVDIDVDGAGHAHIVYTGNADGDGYAEIIYAKNSTGSFVETVMADGWYDSGSGNYFYNPNIKIDGNGKYHIVYEQQNWGGRASWSDKCIAIQTDAASGNGASGGFDWNGGVTTGKNSLALDASGNAYVLYYSGGTMYYGVMTNSWAGSALATGSQGAIAVYGGTVAIAYNDGTDHIAYNVNTGSGFGTPQTVDAGRYPSVALNFAHHILYDKSDGSDREIFLASDAGPLPIQLASFVATECGDAVSLQWQTISELNNYGFYVQRLGIDGVTYADLPGSFIAGHGTTGEGNVYSFVDNAPQGDGWYRLRQIDLDGSVHLSEPVRVMSTTGVESNGPAVFALSQNYPNPFNPATQISFQTGQAGQVRLVVFDQLGREVATLVNGVMPAGIHAASFNAAGHASGVYFARLTSGSQTSMIRMLLMK